MSVIPGRVVAGLGERAAGRLQQHALLLDPERIPLITLVFPAGPQPFPPVRVSLGLTQSPRVAKVNHALELPGCPFLVGKGGHEAPIADEAIATIGCEPGVPRARDPLCRPPPVLKLLSLPQRRLGNPRAVVISGMGVHLRGPASFQAERHVPIRADADVDSASRRAITSATSRVPIPKTGSDHHSGGPPV